MCYTQSGLLLRPFGGSCSEVAIWQLPLTAWYWCGDGKVGRHDATIDATIDVKRW